MSSIANNLSNVWQKNWPEIQAAATNGLPRFIFARNPGGIGQNIPVFFYHVIEPDLLESHLNFLIQNGYITINSDEMLEHLNGSRIAPERSVVLTFDDGPRNHYEVVYPLLKRFKMKGVAFVCPAYHEEEDRASLSNGIDHHLPPPLSWPQIREMHESGIIDFQSHTYEHRYIPRWPEEGDPEGSDPEITRSLRGPALTIANDLELAKEILEQKLNKKVRHLAFPRFNGTNESLQLGSDCGYEGFWWGVLPHRPINQPGQSPQYIVRIDARYLRRLPGMNREPLNQVLGKRYYSSLLRLRNKLLLRKARS